MKFEFDTAQIIQDVSFTKTLRHSRLILYIVIWHGSSDIRHIRVNNDRYYYYILESTMVLCPQYETIGWYCCRK